ncbi:hypothetical protein EB809_20795 [Marinobacter sp. R17]|uniref:DUF6547 family protein n=1 Tax=Marinobacter sp. R17 TaxID=2484250 RepID=UPI000F4B0C92|nr:DUF6547 family protein [Marinobacter sp. R17]ROT93290.1 hypothetical protein EB809_20795 [Marinobacter sp. R17]
MSREVEEYKSFVDSLVGIKDSAAADWARAGRFPEVPENESVNQLLASLTDAQRAVLGSVIQSAKESGVHDALVYLNEKMVSGEIQITQSGAELPVEPFGTELYFDWIARCEGDEWPE